MSTHSTVLECRVIDMPVFKLNGGNLVIHNKPELFFDTKRIFYLYNVPKNKIRGEHAHKELQELIIAIQGSFEVELLDAMSKKKYFLGDSKKGLHVIPGIWIRLKNFSDDAVALVLASDNYIDEDYIRDFKEFQKYKKNYGTEF